MAIHDKNTEFSLAQDLAQTNATYTSTNYLDLGAAPTVPGGLVGTLPIDPGRGRPLQLYCQITTTFTTSAGGTLRVEFVSSASTTISSTPTVHLDTGVLAVTNLTDGFQFPNIRGPLPEHKTYLRYCGMLYIIGTGAMTAGNVTAGLTLDRQNNPTVATQVT